ncbi:hypothetical protein ACFY5D_19325 [Paeniglutamicibacter sp. NPDC012692]|uniref:hypothetical protein n=1 Tax=Paeniglutamicibacter sp. NPDC012692 TaxID=3364388 RepID=UPI0036ABBE97
MKPNEASIARHGRKAMGSSAAGATGTETNGGPFIVYPNNTQYLLDLTVFATAIPPSGHV